MNLKTRYIYLLYKPTKKRQRFHIWKGHVTMTKKGKNLLIWKSHVTMSKNDAYIRNEMQLQNHSLTFFHKNKTFLSATSSLCRSPMAYTTTASLHKLTRTDYLDFGKFQDKFGRFSWSKNDSNYLDVKFKVCKKDDEKEFQLVQNLTIGEADFNQFMRLKNRLVNAVENFARGENLTPVLISTMSKDIDEQLKLAHNVVDILDRANKKICVTLLRYNVDKPESSYAQVRLFAREKEDEKFQQVLYVNYKLEDFIYLLDVMNFVYYKVITNKHICNVAQKSNCNYLLFITSFHSSLDQLKMNEASFSS